MESKCFNLTGHNFRNLFGELDEKDIWHYPGTSIVFHFDNTARLSPEAVDKLHSISKEEVVQISVDQEFPVWQDLKPLYPYLLPQKVKNLYELLPYQII
jgi:hypothetical protein